VYYALMAKTPKTIEADPTATISVTFEAPQDLDAELKEFGDATERNRSQAIRYLLRQGLLRERQAQTSN